ncbi:J domain-containing protein [Thermodesulfobacteriota bacterium]
MDNAADPYEVLGVTPYSTEREVKQRYRILSKKFHPDLKPNDLAAEERFKQIQRAYEHLKVSTQEKPAGETDPNWKSVFDPSVDFSRPFYGFFEALRTYCAAMRPRNDDQ